MITSKMLGSWGMSRAYDRQRFVAAIGRSEQLGSEVDMRKVGLDESLQAKTEQLTAVTDAMAGFLADGNWRKASSTLLSCALRQTESEYGFIGVLTDVPTLRILAHEGIVWRKDKGRDFYDEAMRTYEQVGYLEFTSFDNLFGKVLTTGKTIISNNPTGDPRSGGLPSGHPPLRHFL